MKINYKFKNKELLERALTHSSKSPNNYERREYIFQHCKEDEGKLTVLRSHYVSENYMSSVFDKLDLKNDVRLGKSWQGDISKAIKDDVVEAVLAAIYLDAGENGIEEARKFIFENFDLQNYKSIVDDNYKSRLQELVQGNFKCKIQYLTEAYQDGFKASFYMDEDKISTGKGKSKVEAEQQAAKNAIEKLFLIS